MKKKDKRLEEARGKPKGRHGNDPERRISCSGCGKIMRRAEFPYLKVRWGRAYRFCSPECVGRADTRALAIPAILGSTVLAILTVAIILTAPWSQFMPHTEAKFAPTMDSLDNRDIIFKNVIAHKDGFSSEVEIEILLTNRGKGSTGKLFVDVFAENQTSMVIDSTFNTSTLRYIENGSTGSILPPMKSAKVNGLLVLRPGTHVIYMRIYEDGLMGFIEGQRAIKVTEDQIDKMIEGVLGEAKISK